MLARVDSRARIARPRLLDRAPEISTSRPAPQPQKKKSRSVVREVLTLEICLFVCGLVLLVVLNAVAPGARALLELALAGSLAAFSAASLVIALAALPSTRLPKRTSAGLPATTAIVAAYLPNESTVLADSIRAHLRNGPDDLRLIVAYNTPEPMEFEQELRRIESLDDRVHVVHVRSSSSKADNVNAALGYATGEIVGVFDADHQPGPGGFERAAAWMDAGYDVVQGRCVVRRGEQRSRREGLLSTIVGAEFETMYAVGHPGRTRLHGFGLFGGSNGYWRADVLREVLFDSTALTEDIDASVRLLERGGRIATDPGIVSSELAPPSWSALANQRLRWAQGWFQVSRRHLRGLSTSRLLTRRQRAGAGWLFGFGVIAPWLASLTLPFMVFNVVAGSASPWRGWIGALVTLGTVAFLMHTAVAYRHASVGGRKLAGFAMYVVASVVFYAQMRVALVRLGHIHELLGRTEWRVTPRNPTSGSGVVDA